MPIFHLHIRWMPSPLQYIASITFQPQLCRENHLLISYIYKHQTITPFGHLAVVYSFTFVTIQSVCYLHKAYHASLLGIVPNIKGIDVLSQLPLECISPYIPDLMRLAFPLPTALKLNPFSQLQPITFLDTTPIVIPLIHLQIHQLHHPRPP